MDGGRNCSKIGLDEAPFDLINCSSTFSSSLDGEYEESSNNIVNLNPQIEEFNFENLVEKFLQYPKGKNLQNSQLEGEDKLKMLLGENLVKTVQEMLLDSVSDLHLKFYWLSLHSSKQLQDICILYTVSKSGTKPQLASRILGSLDSWNKDTDKKIKIEYLGQQLETPSIKLVNALDKKFSPYKIFAQYFPDSYFEKLVNYTNLKAEFMKNSEDVPSWYKSKNWPPKYLNSWKPLDLSNFKIWLAVLIGRTSIAKGVRREEFWEKDGLVDYSKNSSLMGRDRWSIIKSCFSIYDVNYNSSEEINPYWKCREALGRFSTVCQ